MANKTAASGTWPGRETDTARRARLANAEVQRKYADNAPVWQPFGPTGKDDNGKPYAMIGRLFGPGQIANPEPPAPAIEWPTGQISAGIVLRLHGDKSCQYDNRELGAGYTIEGREDFKTWDVGADYLNTVLWAKNRDGADGIEWVVARHLATFGLDLIDFCIFEDGRLTMNRDEDQFGNELSDAESTRRTLQLYLADYNIYVEVLPDERRPDIAELKTLFPSLTTY